MSDAVWVESLPTVAFFKQVLYHVRSIDHNIPAGRVFEIVNYWQILFVNPPLPEVG
jgi:hypothetical protein